MMDNLGSSTPEPLHMLSIQQDLRENQIVARGHKVDGLYQLGDTSTTQVFFSTRQQSANKEVWHRQLGHANDTVFDILRKINKIRVMNSAGSSSICEFCQMSKSSRLPFEKSSYVATYPLEKVHCDLWGPSPVKSNQLFSYYVVFVDQFSRYSWLYPLKVKSDFTMVFQEFKAKVENLLDRKIKTLQSDGGGEFCSAVFLRIHAENGIQHLIFCPHTPQQNGLAERKHRHIVELGLAMMFQSKVPQSFWVESFVTSNFIINLLPSSSLQYQTPYQTLFQRAPEYEFLRTFGCRCYPYLPCIFIGYSDKYKGYWCLYQPTGKVYTVCHVLFDECVFPYATIVDGLQGSSKELLDSWLHEYDHLHTSEGSNNGVLGSELGNNTTLPRSDGCPPVTTEFSALDSIVSAESLFPVDHDSLPGSSFVEHDQHTRFLPEPEPASDSVSQTFSPEFADANLPYSAHDPSVSGSGGFELTCPAASPLEPSLPFSRSNAHPMCTRAKVGIIKPNPKYSLYTELTVPKEPKTVSQALNHFGWKSAMDAEMRALKDNETWVLVPKTADMNIIGSKWVFKTKLKADGSVERLKARLVAKGYTQEEGIDYLETFSPVVKAATVRLVLSVVVIQKWTVRQLDVSNAFLNGVLSEPAYMQQPPGFESLEFPSYVCSLRKALYGLKQAPRAWFDCFSSTLLRMGFLCSRADPSLFVKRGNGYVFLLLVYVDDIMITGNKESEIDSLIASLASEFKLKDLGLLHYFLGVEAISNTAGLFLYQSKYAKELLQRANMLGCKPMSTPSLVKPSVLQSVDLFSDPKLFRQLAGALQYLTFTRPDLSYVVNCVCQKMHKPSVTDYQALKRILRFVQGSLHNSIQLYQSSSMQLYGLSDADWAGCKTTRRSTTGYCTFLGRNLLSWSAKRQSTVSRSSTEAEYRALASATAELLWLSFVFRDIGVSYTQPVRLYCDNLSALYLTVKPILHSRSKHIEIDFHFVHERVASGFFETVYLPTHFQLADLFTKPLSKEKILYLSTKLCIGLHSLRG